MDEKTAWKKESQLNLLEQENRSGSHRTGDRRPAVTSSDSTTIKNSFCEPDAGNRFKHMYSGEVVCYQ